MLRKLSIIMVSILMPSILMAQSSLWLTEKHVQAKYQIENMEVSELAAYLAGEQAGDYLLFDVRSPDEYRVSHIKGAINLDPAMSAETFMQKYVDLIVDKYLVFYCSVGYRSSALAERVKDSVVGAKSIANLKGGIFRWYNDGNAVCDQKCQITDEIHPFSKSWGKMVKER